MSEERGAAPDKPLDYDVEVFGIAPGLHGRPGRVRVTMAPDEAAWLAWTLRCTLTDKGRWLKAALDDASRQAGSDWKPGPF